jgi:hypothetical protein
MQISGDRIFDVAFAAASNAQPITVTGEPYAGEYAFADALMKVSELLADALSPCPGRQQAARNRLDLLLSSGKESS